MKLTLGKIESKIKNLSKDQRLLLYIGLFIFTISAIYQIGIAISKFYYYITH